MATFVTLARYRGSISGGGPERFKQVQAIAADNGGSIDTVYGLLGPYDVVSIGQFPDEKAAMKASAAIGNLIGAETLTMPAVPRDEFLAVLAGL